MSLSSIVLTNMTIKYGSEGGSLAGAHATVETTGDIERRITATRLVGTGVLALAWRKKADHREHYLTVEGNGFAFVVPLDAKQGKAAREVAARINSLASQAQAAAPAEAAPSGVGDQLAKLAELHAAGALTDDEFSAAKAKALGL